MTHPPQWVITSDHKNSLLSLDIDDYKDSLVERHCRPQLFSQEHLQQSRLFRPTALKKFNTYTAFLTKQTMKMLLCSTFLLPLLPLLGLGHSSVSHEAPSWVGANLGSSFVVEDWLYEGDTSSADGTAYRWHMSAMTPAEMKDHLTKRISRENFVAMRDYGVRVLRLPVGYWNFVSFAAGYGPNVPAEDAEFMDKLEELMSPAQYRPHLARAFSLAAEFGMQILLDLHALPGSQNGEMHSGWREKKGLSNAAKAEQSHFDTPWNWSLALGTNEQAGVLEKMVDFVLDWAAASEMPLASVLYGIQVINEPNAAKFGPRFPGSNDYRPYQDLMRYYDLGIRTMRDRGLPLHIPVILFAWTYEMQNYLARMDREPLLRFSQASNYSIFGQVVWDTHIYNAAFDGDLQQRIRKFPASTGPRDWRDPSSAWRSRLRTEIINPAYKGDLNSMRSFTSVFGNQVIVGEWTLAGVDASDGGKIFAFGEEITAMFRGVPGLLDNFYWTFGGLASRNVGTWDLEVAASQTAGASGIVQLSGRQDGSSGDGEQLSVHNVFQDTWGKRRLKSEL